MTPAQPGLTTSGLTTQNSATSSAEQADQRDERPVAEQPAPGGGGQPGAAGVRGAGDAAHARARRIWTRLPIMTTPIRMSALHDDREVRC